MNSQAIYQQLVDDASILAIVSTRVYRDAPPKNPTLPYILYFDISDEPDNPVDYYTERWQINLIGSLRPSNQSQLLDTLEALVSANLDNFTGTLGSGSSTQVVKSVKRSTKNSSILPDHKEKQVSVDFLFNYLR